MRAAVVEAGVVAGMLALLVLVLCFGATASQFIYIDF